MPLSENTDAVTRRRVVLVADDDDAIRDLVAAIVDELGLVPLQVSDGAAAIEADSSCYRVLVCVILISSCRAAHRAGGGGRHCIDLVM
jgi:DNA-binding NtrC family response regulator